VLLRVLVMCSLEDRVVYLPLTYNIADVSASSSADDFPFSKESHRALLRNLLMPCSLPCFFHRQSRIEAWRRCGADRVIVTGSDAETKFLEHLSTVAERWPSYNVDSRLCSFLDDLAALL
jgi:hypothetical protein